MARRFVWEEKLDRMKKITNVSPPGGKKRWETFLEPIRHLLELEPVGSEFQLPAFETLLGDTILTTNEWSDFDWFKSVHMEWWSSMAHHNDIRRHFQDDIRRFGMGPGSMETGDEVWIVGGCGVPCLLRPAGEGEHRLIGEVYMYNIMDGELADHDSLREVEQIMLI
jgi:hypothetical protein